MMWEKDTCRHTTQHLIFTYRLFVVVVFFFLFLLISFLVFCELPHHISKMTVLIVFFLSISIFAVLVGTLIYLVESGVEGTKFTNIPISVYYTVVTITTLGFGDITPTTPVGMFLTALAVLTGYAIIAVPTGIVSAEMSAARRNETTEACPSCGVHGHLHDARFCRRCGERLKNGK